MIRNRTFRYLTLGAIAFYVVIPMYASIQFSLQGSHGHLSLANYSTAVELPGLGHSVVLSLWVAFLAMAVTLVLLVPTILYVNLRLPKVRPLLDAVSLLPLGVPAIVTVIGVQNGLLDHLPNLIVASPAILVLEYVILALPYSYRAIDSGVRSIDLRTLVEAGRSMGASWGKLFVSVLFPNIGSGILAAAFLTVALALGEYTFAVILLSADATFPVFLSDSFTSNFYAAVALSVMALLVTWALFVALSLVGGRRRGRGALAVGVADPQAPRPADAREPAGAAA